MVLVGGDGFYHEAVNILERKALEDKGLDENLSEISLQQISLPIGIVPAGRAAHRYLSRNGRKRTF